MSVSISGFEKRGGNHFSFAQLAACYRRLLKLEITFVPSSHGTERETNNYNILYEHNQDYYRQSFFIRTVELWNSLPSCTKAINSLFSFHTRFISIYLPSMNPIVLRGKMHGVRDFIYFIFFSFFLLSWYRSSFTSVLL